MSVTLEMLALLWAIGAGLLALAILVSWFRIGRMRDLLEEIRKLLTAAQGVNLLHEVKRLRADVERQIEDMELRLKPLERDREADRAEFLETNRKMLKAMDALRIEWQQQREAFVIAVAAEVRAVFAGDVQRIVRQEFYRLHEKEKTPGEG